jgi:hypothetical protein
VALNLPAAFQLGGGLAPLAFLAFTQYRGHRPFIWQWSAVLHRVPYGVDDPELLRPANRFQGG